MTCYISYLFPENGEIVQSAANQFGRIIDEHFSEAKKQTAIQDLFKEVLMQFKTKLYVRCL